MCNYKKIFFLTSAAISIFVSTEVFANKMFGPERMVCTRDNDINSCHCQTNNTNLPDWRPIIVEESHIYKGIYNFHSVSIDEDINTKKTKTDTLVQYFIPQAGDILVCRYSGNTLMPDMLTAGYWLNDFYDNVNHFYCGTFNYGTSRESCPMIDTAMQSK